MGHKDNAYTLSAGVLRQAENARSTQAGARAETVGDSWPTTNALQVGDVVFLIAPIQPRRLSQGVIDLQTDSAAASVVTLVVAPAEDARTSANVAGRDFFAEIKFGTGNATQTARIDLAIGGAIRLPTAIANVEFFDETPQPGLPDDPPPPYHEVTASGGVAYGTGGCRPQRSQSCWFPFYAGQAADDPPNLPLLFTLVS